MEQNSNPTAAVQPQPTPESAAHEKSIRLKIGLFGFFLFITFVVGLFWMITTPELTVGLTLSFVAGLSMIFLPCTLPLAFVIVPLTMGKDPKKGLLMALSFTLGLTITLSLYGVFIAAAGKAFGLKSDAEVYAVLLGGFAAFIFGLSEVGLINFKLPSYSGKFPDFIQRRKDYMKTFLLGLLLGNAGVGCPNPAFYLLLGYIATTGDLFNGWFLGFVHGMGRSVPLIFLAILGTLGVNALSGVARHKEGIQKVMGWMLLIIGAYLLTFGIFGHDWFIGSGIHSAWEQFVVNVTGERFGETILKHEHQIFAANYIKYGNMFFLGLLALTFLIAFIFKRPTRRTIVSLTVTYALIALVIGYSTGWTFKLGTKVHIQFQGVPAAAPHGNGEESMMNGAHEEGHGETLYHEEGEIKSGPAVNLNITPVPFRMGQVQKLDFFVNEKPGNIPVPASSLEIVSTKLMHVIGVRSDMNEFFHIHPVRAEEYYASRESTEIADGKKPKVDKFSESSNGVHPSPTSTPGNLLVDKIFSKPGLYKIWSEIKKDGIDHVFGHPEISVSGEGARDDKKVTFGRSMIVNNFQMILNLDEPVAKGHEHNLTFEIHGPQGEDVELEEYLGTSIHLTLIKDDWKQFIHVHPVRDAEHAILGVNSAIAEGDEQEFSQPTEISNGARPENGDHQGRLRIIPEARANGGDSHGAAEADVHGINFNVTFPEAGLYKVFAQFQPKGIDLSQDEALTASFWVEVKESAPSKIPSWWILLIVSLILMVLLSFGVRKFLRVDPKKLEAVKAD